MLDIVKTKPCSDGSHVNVYGHLSDSSSEGQQLRLHPNSLIQLVTIWRGDSIMVMFLA